MEESNPQTTKGVDVKQANKALYITLGIIAIVIAAVIIYPFIKPTGAVINNNASGPYVSLEIGNSPVLGEASAPVTIYEFSDFSCPYCAAADGYNEVFINQLKSQIPTWEAPLPAIIQDYVNTGKVKLVYKYYPGHGTGQAAEEVGFALAQENDSLFWKFHDLAFANQEDTGDLTKMKALAEQIGANMTQVDNFLSSGQAEQMMQNDVAMGTSNGVRATPSFFINGKLLEGAEPYSSFKQQIDSALGNTN